MTSWFPFFSMLFWLCTKIAGLSLMLFGFFAFLGMLNAGFDFWLTVSAVLTVAAGGFVLTTELLYDLGVAEMQRRHAVQK